MSLAPHASSNSDVAANRRSGERPRVVVVGGGFAGMETVRNLKDAPVDVVLIDRRPFSTFQPLLYQVATGGLNHGDITHSLRSFTSQYDNARFRQGTVVAINNDRSEIETDDGAILGYDYLVLAVGAVGNYFGVEGAEQHSMHIYSAAAAVQLRDRIFTNLEAVAQGRESAKEPVVVVVGAGPTGIEMSGQLAELVEGTGRAFPDLDSSRIKIILVEMADTVLRPFHPKLQSYAHKEIVKRGVEVNYGVSVVKVTPDGVELSDGRFVAAMATVWASGVKVPDIVDDWDVPRTDRGRILIDEDLRVNGRQTVFAVGDVAATADDPLPQLAQPAMDGGQHVASQIMALVEGRAPEPFVFKSKGTMAIVGRFDALVEFPNGMRLTGFLGWLAWVGLHIIQLMSARNRLATMANLMVRFVTARGQTNVIVGETDPSLLSTR